jgi:hypothetical protein
MSSQNDRQGSDQNRSIWNNEAITTLNEVTPNNICSPSSPPASSTSSTYSARHFVCETSYDADISNSDTSISLPASPSSNSSKIGEASRNSQQLRSGWLEELEAHRSSRRELEELKMRMRNACSSLAIAQNAISPVRQNLEEEMARAERKLSEMGLDDSTVSNGNLNQYSRLQTDLDSLQERHFWVLKVLNEVEDCVIQAKHDLR